MYLLHLLTLSRRRTIPSAGRLCLALVVSVAVPLVTGQVRQSREYVRIGGRTIAIENYLLRTTINPSETLALSSLAAADWSLAAPAQGNLLGQLTSSKAATYRPPSLPDTAAPVTDTLQVNVSGQVT